VFLVMYLFLQNFRYTIIPTIVVPVALLGTFAVLLALGFSINVLTMFGMVLVIGIVVDDAIVVVENVERIMSEEGLPPREATRKAMGQISGRHRRRHRGAGVGVRAAGLLRRRGGQHLPPVRGRDGGTSILFSAFMALSLTPALCATLLKPVKPGTTMPRRASSAGSTAASAHHRAATKAGRAHAARAAHADPLCRGRGGGGGLCSAPADVLPAQRGPGQHAGQRAAAAGCDAGAHARVMEQVEGYMLKQPEVQSMVSVLGFSFSGQGQNAALAFVTLKDWDQRTAPGSRRRRWPGAPSARWRASATPSSSR
jgi:multidrug efflux pump